MQRVLVVEGEPDLGEVICYYLTDAGYEVTIVHDGQAGLQEMCKRKPDLILINEQLDQVTRYQFIAQVRKTEGLSSVPIVAMVKGRVPTGRVLDAGASAVVQVPERLETLAPMVKELLAGNQPERQLAAIRNG